MVTDFLAVPTDHTWSEAIHVQLDQLGSYRVVGSTREALEVLTHGWPVDGGDECILAIFTCREVLDGNRPVSDGRTSLVRALQEARLVWKVISVEDPAR